MLCTCPECGNEVSENASFCPKCGLRSPAYHSKEMCQRRIDEYKYRVSDCPRWFCWQKRKFTRSELWGRLNNGVGHRAIVYVKCTGCHREFRIDIEEGYSECELV